MWVAIGGEPETAAALIRAGADVTVLDDHGRTALDLATKAGRAGIADLLAQAGAEQAGPHRVQRSVDRGASSASLIEAAKNGDEAAVRFWLAQGVEVDSADERGRTPLMLAASDTHIFVMEELLRAGAEVGIRDHNGQTALLKATIAGFEVRHVVDLLIAHGADVNAMDMDGGFPLIAAARAGDLEVVDALLRAGADVNAKTEDGWSALVEAAFDGRSRIVERLLEHGARVDDPDVNGRGALHQAAGAGRTSLIGVLVQHGAALDRADNRGSTPLMRAAENGHMDVVRSLLELGADPRLVDKQGQTARTIAIREAQTVIAGVLDLAEAAP